MLDEFAIGMAGSNNTARRLIPIHGKAVGEVAVRHTVALKKVCRATWAA